MSISVSEFAEDVLGMNIPTYQLFILEKMYEIYKEDPENFKINVSKAVSKCNNKHTIYGLMSNVIIIDKFYKFENEEVKENE